MGDKPKRKGHDARPEDRARWASYGKLGQAMWSCSTIDNGLQVLHRLGLLTGGERLVIEEFTKRKRQEIRERIDAMRETRRELRDAKRREHSNESETLPSGRRK